MARKRATMREGPLAELFRKTEAAQRSQDAAVENEPVGGVEEPAQERRGVGVAEVGDHHADGRAEPTAQPPGHHVVPVAELLGDELWSLTEPDREPPSNRHAPGIGFEELERTVERLERL